MRCEIIVPYRRLGEFQHRAHHSPHQLRIVAEVQRRGRIGHVHGGGTAVGMAFLGNEQRIPLLIGHQLVGRYGLAVCGRTYFCIRFAALHGLFFHLFLESIAAPKQFVMSGHCFGNGFVDGFAVPCPISGKELAEIIDGRNVIVSRHQRRLTPRRPYGMELRRRAQAPVHLMIGYFHRLPTGCRQIQIAPVDGDAVPAVP